MTVEMVRQTAFTIGEVDSNLYKRTDIKSYLSAAQSLLNVEVSTTGIAKKRKGTTFLLDVSAYADINGKMYEFVDKNNNYYLILSADTATGWSVFTVDSSTGAIAHLQNLSTPYSSADLPFIDYTLSNDVLVLTHPSYAPARIYVSNYSGPVFSYAALVIQTQPSFDFNTVDYSKATVEFTTSATTFSMVLSGTIVGAFTADWIGGQVVGFGATAEQSVGYGIITAVSGSNPYTISGVTQIQFAASANMPTSGNQYVIRQPAFTSALGYPAKVLFYQNRLWFANTLTLPDTVFGSVLNQPVSFDVGVGSDADAIIYTIGQSNSGPILALNGGKQLEIFTQNYEFAAPQEQNIGLTPSTFSIRQQSSYGSSSLIKPITYINDTYYIPKTGASIINFHYDGIGQTYTSSNISVASTHLVKSPINRALQRGSLGSQDNFIYYLNQDSTVTAFQFAAEYELAALTPIEFTGLQIGNEPGDEPQPIQIGAYDITAINNKIYFYKQYTLTGVYGIEIFDDSTRIDTTQTVTMDFYSPTLGIITGLDAYDGYVMQIVFDGQDYGLTQNSAGHVAAITGGIAYVNNPEGNTGDTQIGFLYDIVVTPMYVFAGALQSNYFKFISRIFIDYYLSLDFQVNGYQVPYQMFAVNNQFVPLTPQTDTFVIGSEQGWHRFDTLTITQSSPFDLQITAIAYQIEAEII